MTKPSKKKSQDKRKKLVKLPTKQLMTKLFPREIVREMNRVIQENDEKNKRSGSRLQL